MDDERDAEDAIRGLDQIEFGKKGRRLRIEWSKEERSSRRPEITRKSSSRVRPSKTLFVINFDPNNTRSRDLERHFDPYGKILNIRIRRNFAFIQYETQEDATRALDATHMSKLMDQVITVEYANKDDDDRKNGFSPDRNRDRRGGGLERGYDRGRSRSPYGRERASPDYGRGRVRSPSPRRQGRSSPDYGRRLSPNPSHRERNSPDYGRRLSPNPNRRERNSSDYGRRLSPNPNHRERERNSPNYGRRLSPNPNHRERNSPGYGRRLSPNPNHRERERNSEYGGSGHSPSTRKERYTDHSPNPPRLRAGSENGHVPERGSSLDVDRRASASPQRARREKDSPDDGYRGRSSPRSKPEETDSPGYAAAAAESPLPE